MVSSHTSAWISVFSGIGLVTALVVVPTKTEKWDYDSPSIPNPGNRSIPRNYSIKEERELTLQTNPLRFQERDYTIAKTLDQWNFRAGDASIPGAYFTSDSSRYSIESSSFVKIGGNSWELSPLRSINSHEVKFPIVGNFGGVVQGSLTEFTDGRQRQSRSVSLAGLSIGGNSDFFQAKILAGDLVQQTQSTYSSLAMNQIRPTDPLKREAESQRIYEWQANFRPSDYVKFQTAIYNQRQENTLNITQPDGGKLSLFFGGKTMQLNLKYNYMTNRRAFGGGSDSIFNPTTDLATLGFLFFLDPSQNYSIYLGNSFYNVFNDPLNRVRDAQGKTPSTFSASFRGRARDSTSFFLNFHNQFFYDGMMPGLPGTLAGQGMRFQGRTFYEVGGALGLEIFF